MHTKCLKLQHGIIFKNHYTSTLPWNSVKRITELFNECNKHQLVSAVTYTNRSPTCSKLHWIIFREEQMMSAKVIFGPYIICLIMYCKMFHT
jgi:hypothetical protein